MENKNQKNLENLKNFPIELLMKKDFYVDILIDDKWHQGYIKEEKQNNKYDVIYLSLPNKILTKTNITRKGLTFFGDNYYQNNNNIREVFLDDKLNKLEINDLYDMLLDKLAEIKIDYGTIENIVTKIEENENYNNKIFDNYENYFDEENKKYLVEHNNNVFNITGFYSYQFFSGFFIDAIVFINNKLEAIRLSNVKENKNLHFDENFEKLLNSVLNIIIFVLVLGENKISKIKDYIQFNRKNILINKINSILASIEIIIPNILLINCYEYFEIPKIENKLKIITNLCYEIILNSGKNNTFLPLQFLISLINFIAYEDNILRIENFDKNKVYKIFLNTIQNITVEDIKYIKNFSQIKVYCNTIIKKLYKGEKKVLINNCYYNFLMNSLTKSNILEKKIMALNCINDIIINLVETENELNMIFNEFFINKNKIMNIFFEETVHDEILKRSIELFKYLSLHDSLKEGLLDKLIRLNNNSTIRNILCEIIKNIKKEDKKINLFKRITKDFNFDNNDNTNNIIEFVSKLTLACFSPNENQDSHIMENDITNGNSSSNDSSSYNKNIIRENISENKRISINIQILKSNNVLNNRNQKKNFTRNISTNSLEKFIMNSSAFRRVGRVKSLRKDDKIIPKKNYYGLDLLYDYIIYNFNMEKALINNSNVTKAIKAFKYILDSTRVIKLNDIYYFLDKSFNNINSNKKNNSIVQSLILMEILINKLLYCNNNNKNNNIYNINQNTNSINFNDLEINEEEGQIISKLDQKYDIISLLTEELIRYVSKVNSCKKKKENYKDEIFEGIYPYMKNISTRLKILFYFVNFGLYISEENHIIKIYSLFKSEKFQEEKNLFFREIAYNIDSIHYETLKNIFSKIFQNNTLFDKSTFNEEETFDLIRELFTYINLYNESLIDDTKSIRVNQDLNKLQGIDYLFDILISNKNITIQNKLCKILSKLCLFLSNYKNDFCTKYWNNFINKITDLMNECNIKQNTIGILGLVQLIESIYSYNFAWKIPTKEETHIAKEPFYLFRFCCPQRENKIYKLKVGKVDKILHMRWKLAYFYDIYINDLVICDNNKKQYNFTYDNTNFYEIFPPKKYLISETKFTLINVYEIPGQLLKIPNNPKELIEKNETIINILIDNLSHNIKNNEEKKNEEDFLMKKKIWNIMQKLPKKQYIEKTIKQYGESVEIDYQDIIKKFNVNEIFILTFNLQCILIYLYPDSSQENIKARLKQINKYLETFINFNHIDRTLYSCLMSININNNKENKDDNNNKFIYFECLKYLLELIQIIEEYKRKKTFSFLLNSINRDKETIHTKYDFGNDNNSNYDLDSTKVNNSLILKDTILEVVGHKLLYNKLTDIMLSIINDKSSSNELISYNLLQELIKFIEHIKLDYSTNNSINNYQDYFEFIFENEDLFKKIFIFDYIKCPREEIKKLISSFLLKNLFDSYLISKNKNTIKDKDKNSENRSVKNIKNYFDIILTAEMFDYLVNNTNNGSYFNLISSIIEKYITYYKKVGKNRGDWDLDDDEENNKYIDNFKKIIDSIVNNLQENNKNIHIINKNSNKQDLLIYPYKTDDSASIRGSISSNAHKIKNQNNENDSLINGVLLYLLKILELSAIYENSVIDYFSEKVDICDFLLTKGILNKNSENNLFNNDSSLNTSKSHKIIFEILIFLLKNIDNHKNIIDEHNYLEDSLYMKIWKIINKYHKLEFWKKNKNFELEYNDCNRKEFIGLKNMSSTCYMNSILQQFFMIPMLRETLLSIGNDNNIIDKNNLNQNTVLYQLQLLFASLKAYDFKYYDPKNFVLVSKLSFYEQMDADEYYGQLIDKLENDINNLFDKDKNKNVYLDLFKYFFGIKLTDELYFIECDHKRFNESFCYNIQLEVKNYSNIYDSLKNYFKIEIMSGDNKINCEECNTKRVCHKQLKIKNLPNILVISLKRFDYDYRTMTKFKLNNYFEFPPELDMSEYIINSNNNKNNIENNISEKNIYELTGITIHYGVSDYGHYYDLIKASNNKWYVFNDTNIKEFPENDIPKEAFGERDNDNDLDGETSEKANINQKDKKNAYILIYTKKTFENKFTQTNEYKTKLIFPPYNKYSNINNNFKSYIKYKMFKYWTLENLSNSYYQGFIINLLKMDLVKNIEKEINKEYKVLITQLKEEEYLPIKNYINTGNTIFSFGLLYFCNIMLRAPKEKNNIQIYKEILNIYLENDTNKCLYILEEFSYDETIDEFLFSNKNIEVVKTISELISLSFNTYLAYCEHDNETKNLDLFKFLNSIILFISNKTNALSSNISSLDNVVKLLYDLINKKSIFLKYLKNKNIDNWLDEIINKIYNAKSEMATIENNDNNINNVDNDENISMNRLLTEGNFPKLESNHCILKEKSNDFNFGIYFRKSQDIKSLQIKSHSKKGKHTSINSCDSIVLLRRLQDDIKFTKI